MPHLPFPLSCGLLVPVRPHGGFDHWLARPCASALGGALGCSSGLSRLSLFLDRFWEGFYTTVCPLEKFYESSMFH